VARAEYNRAVAVEEEQERHERELVRIAEVYDYDLRCGEDR
jgi:hypothetical protein